MDPQILNEENFTLFAVHHYDNPECRGLSKLEEDLNRFKYLKRLFHRYKENGELKERLILNHLIILYNVFGPNAATKMLFYKIDKEFYPQLKTFLVFLNFMPLEIISDRKIVESDIPLDEDLVKVLRGIKDAA